MIGYVDELVFPNTLKGWARSGEIGPTSAVSVEVVEGKKVRGQGRADNSRPDLGQNTGFSVTMAETIDGDDLLSGRIKVYGCHGNTRVILPLSQGLQDRLVREGCGRYLDEVSRSTKCIFTSAGDFHNLRQWIPVERARGWDLIVAFYGDDDQKYDEICDMANYTIRRKGSKFQNIWHLYKTNPSCFAHYDYIWVMDDDIVITPRNVDKCFALADWLDIWVCSPSFDPKGRISYFDTVQQRNNNQSEVARDRLVTFVEITCPIFKKDKLESFLGEYDGSLFGYGIDHWYCNFFKTNKHGRAGVFDSISVLNPQDHQRIGKSREILKLASDADRFDAWRRVQRRLHLKNIAPKTLGVIEIRLDRLPDSLDEE